MFTLNVFILVSAHKTASIIPGMHNIMAIQISIKNDKTITFMYILSNCSHQKCRQVDSWTEATAGKTAAVAGALLSQCFLTYWCS